MQEYVSTSQLHLSKPSCHESKSFFKPPPPKTIHARVCLNFTDPPSKSSCHDSKSFFKPPPQNPPRLLVTIPSHFLNLPPKTLHARVFLNFTASPLQDFLLDAKSFSKPPPPKTLHARVFPSSRLLVTIPSHFLNLPPKTLHARVCRNFTALPIQAFLSRVQVIF